jgi:thermostable 8-oxoguanine DNA glycosylase
VRRYSNCPCTLLCNDETGINIQLAIGEGLMYRTQCTLEMHFALCLWEYEVQRFEYIKIVIIVSGVEKVRCDV